MGPGMGAGDHLSGRFGQHETKRGARRGALDNMKGALQFLGQADSRHQTVSDPLSRRLRAVDPRIEMVNNMLR